MAAPEAAHASQIEFTISRVAAAGARGAGAGADADGVPGHGDLARSAHDDRRRDRRAAAGARDRTRTGAAGACRVAAHGGGAAAGACRALPAPVQRRPAAAYRHCPRSRAAAGAARMRRAGQRPGRERAGADPEPARRPATHAGDREPVRLPRPLGGAACLRPADRRCEMLAGQNARPVADAGRDDPLPDSSGIEPHA
ncbi:hypothetical protein SAMN05519104_1468 [Rhizobiales bacterium GAS188]|nr:hypothetical protein SAMN05519104_1468 [Rhizobiales bacterium GAS188]